MHSKTRIPWDPEQIQIKPAVSQSDAANVNLTSADRAGFYSAFSVLIFSFASHINQAELWSMKEMLPSHFYTIFYKFSFGCVY